MRQFVARVGILLLVIFALSCSNASYSDVKNETLNPEFKGGAGKNVLVVVASRDPGSRETVETQFAIEGVERKIKITPSHRLVADAKELTKEKLEELVKANNFDRVIIVRSVPGSASSGKHSDYRDHYSVVGSMSGLYPGGYGGMYGAWGSTVVVTYSPTDPPPSFGTYMNFTVETLFYDATDASLIWNSATRVTSSQRQGEAAENYVKKVLGGLRSKGLV